MEKKTVLLTGPNGFIGRALCQDLSIAGYQVRGAVRKKVGSPVAWATIETGDFTKNFSWSPLLSDVDIVIHTAARVHQMKESSGDLHAVYKQANTEPTLQLLQQAHAAGVTHFVFLSSIKVNGESTDSRPFSEKDPASPQDPYSISKYEAETGIQEFCEQHPEISFSIFRLPLVYGVGVKANFSALLRAVQRNYPLPFKSVHTQRSLLYIGNLLSAIQADLQQDKVKNQVYLLGDGDDVSSAALMEKMGDAYGVKPCLLPIPPTVLRAIGICLGKSKAVSRLLGSLQVDTKKVRTALQWVPPYTVATGLAEMARAEQKESPL